MPGEFGRVSRLSAGGGEVAVDALTDQVDVG